MFLAYKPKGNRAGEFHTIRDVSTYRSLIEACEALGVAYGFDSCSAPMYLESIKDRPDAPRLMTFVEGCESSRESFYINMKGEGFHCSFTEGERNWKTGVDVLGCEDFLKDVWYHPKIVAYRQASIRLMDNNPHKICGDCSECLQYPSLRIWTKEKHHG